MLHYRQTMAARLSVGFSGVSVGIARWPPISLTQVLWFSICMSTQTIYSVRRMVCPLRLYTLFDGWFVHSDYILCSTDGLSTQAIYSVRRMVCPLRLYTLFDGWFVHSGYILCSTDGLSTQAIYSVRRMVSSDTRLTSKEIQGTQHTQP